MILQQFFIWCLMCFCLPIAIVSVENPAISQRTEETNLLQSLKLNLYSNLPTLAVESENVKVQTADENDQLILNAEADLQESEKYQVSRINSDAINANAPVDEDYDMELAEINVFRPVFQYRLAYAKQVKNAQRRQNG